MASKHYHIKFNFDHDKEIIDRIESKENKNDYIRGLVLSDIAADIIRESIKLEEQDPDETKEQAMIDYYNENCPAISNHDPEHTCEGCRFDDGKRCRIEEGWEEHWHNTNVKDFHDYMNKLRKEMHPDG